MHNYFHQKITKQITGRRCSIQALSSLSESHRSAGHNDTKPPRDRVSRLGRGRLFQAFCCSQAQMESVIETLPPANEHTEHNVTRYQCSFLWLGPQGWTTGLVRRRFSLQKALALCADLSLFEECVTWRVQTKLDTSVSHRTENNMMHTDAQHQGGLSLTPTTNTHCRIHWSQY